MRPADARLGRGYSSVGDLGRLPALPAQDDPGSLAPATIGHTKLPGAVLVESDQYYREFLTIVLLSQGFAVHAFTDGPLLLRFLPTVADADLAVLDWDLAKMPGTILLAELRRHGVNLPAVFLADEVIAYEEAVDAEHTALGAVDFIEKSRDKQVLIRRLRRVVELARPKAEVSG